MATTEPANANVEKPALRLVDRERDEVIEIAGDPKQIVKLVAYGVFAGCSEAFARVLARRTLGPSPLLPPLPTETNDPADVMTADEVAGISASIATPSTSTRCAARSHTSDSASAFSSDEDRSLPGSTKQLSRVSDSAMRAAVQKSRRGQSGSRRKGN